MCHALAGDKEMTLDRFAKNYERLSPNLQKRLTVENDDRPNSYSLRELMRLHELTGIPLVFDFHHHKFCDGMSLCTKNSKPALPVLIVSVTAV